ncbi:hypothetical protein PTSG_01919 [Salpingoeca rosetta]|uniref:DNA-directed primase/polymerase protein n=1 Tax=Salpingoeca rosetta (strain ATCC 50818 / BSB-021) TaxID=946362 RepID=F2TZC2_SALR5|nr:uncharacterized protein PTSG_01919 [Salpingoeca rosetta]EGD78946.1 hypothetical protein PTSG_01919 [Salpingoeca rosetta]|eukprot:XP_004997902.1 hypothetical protein PTSG_01919 [Salpingoeca rosetta]
MTRMMVWREWEDEEHERGAEGRGKEARHGTRTIAPSSFYKRAKVSQGRRREEAADPATNEPPQAARNDRWLAKLEEYRAAGEASKTEGYAQVPDQGNLFAPSLVWRTFPLQQMAFDFVTTCSQPLSVYAFETETSTQGKRRFLVSNERFWSRYYSLPPKQRHHYELIRQDSPCHLYLDLEYAREHNPDVDGAALTRRLVELLCRRMNQRYKLRCTPKDAVILDSTTATKFSRHVTIRAPHAAFRNNRHVGAFVRQAVHDLHYASHRRSSSGSDDQGGDSIPRTTCIDTEQHGLDANSSNGGADGDGIGVSVGSDGVGVDGGSDGEGAERGGGGEADDDDGQQEGSGDGTGGSCSADVDNVPGHAREKGMNLKVRDEHGNLVWFVDLGVYTRNRTFRLYLSSKQGKTAVLQLARDCSAQITARAGTEAWHHQVFERSLVCNVEYTEDTRILTCTDGAGGRAGSNISRGGCDASQRLSMAASKDHSGTAITQTVSPGSYEATPYPDVDAFIVRVASRGAARQASIRRWTLFPASKVISYDIAHARYCHHVMREHKSNGVYYVVNLLTGVYYQKCYDPDCRAAQFKSLDRCLPVSLLPFKSHALLDTPVDAHDDENSRSANTSSSAGVSVLNDGDSSNADDDDDDDEAFYHAVDELCSAAEDGVLEHLLHT